MTVDHDAAEVQRRNHELTILNAIAAALNREVDLPQALNATLEQVTELLDLHTGWVWLMSEETGEPYLAASLNLPPALADYPHRMEDSCYCLDIYRAGDMDDAANISIITCTRLKHLTDGTEGLRYHASIPLYNSEKKLGVFNVVSADMQSLSSEDLRLLYTIGDLLSIAIERARLFNRSTRLGAVEERNRLAREIHDTMAQWLSAVVLQLETADALLEAGVSAERARARVNSALNLSRDSLTEVRRSVMDLRAAPLEGRSLAEALTKLIADTTPHTLETTLKVTGADHPLPVAVEAGVYRIAQEAVHNAVQHADAAHLHVKLVVVPERVQLSVADDGRGFDPAHIPPNHFGLTGLIERARLLGGTLDIHTEPGVGTRINAVIPLQERTTHE